VKLEFPKFPEQITLVLSALSEAGVVLIGGQAVKELDAWVKKLRESEKRARRKKK